MTFVESLLFWIANALLPFLIFALAATLLFGMLLVEHLLSKQKQRKITTFWRQGDE